MRTVGLWLEWVGIERGGIVFDLQFMQTIPIMQHEAGTETARTPIVEVVIYAAGIRRKLIGPPIKFTIVAQIVNADLKAIALKFFAQFTTDTIFTFGDKIEGGAEAKALFQLQQICHLVHAELAFDVMRENEREFFAIRPARPVGGDLSCRLVDRPSGGVGTTLTLRQNPPRHHADAPRDIRLEPVVKSVADHGNGD